MDSFKKFLHDYRGALIGLLVAILFMVSGLYELVILVIVLLAGAFIGNYIQNNKSFVKEKLKNIIDRM